MTRLFNQNWITAAGEPIAGRTPTQTRVNAPEGIGLTPDQQAGVASLYAIFCTAVALSPHANGYHVHRRVLIDGTQVTMRSNNGVHIVEVTPTFDPRKLAVYRGFVIKPKWFDAVAATWASVTTLLRAFSTTWGKWVSGYRPGKTGATPTYYTDTRRTKLKKATLIKADARYFDVYCLSGTVLHKNGQPYRQFPSTTRAPVVLRTVVTPPALPVDVLFSIGDSQVDHIAGAPPVATAVFSRAAAITVIVPGQGFTAGVRYTQADERADYLTYNMTVARALQVWAASATLQRTAPWATAPAAAFYQIDPPSKLLSSGGHTGTGSVSLSGPRYGPFESDATVIGYGYKETNTPPANLIGKVYGAALQADTPISIVYYNRSFSGGDSARTLYPGVTVSFSRSLNITNSRKGGSATFFNTVPSSPPFYRGTYDAGSPPPPGWIIIGEPTAFFVYPPGSNFAPAVTEAEQSYEQLDTTTNSATVSGAGVIFQVETTHSQQFSRVSSVDSIPNAPPAMTISTVTTVPIGLDYLVGPTRVNGATVIRVADDNSVTVSGSARDYIFADFENEVFFYLQSTLAASHTSHSLTSTFNGVTSVTNTATGLFEVELKLVLECRSGTFNQVIKNFSAPVSPQLNSEVPQDINFGTSPAIWSYISPQRPQPIFAPMWHVQGLCPHIAYTTKAEELDGVAARMLASFRMQFLLLARPPLLDVPALPGVVSFRPYMFEQLLEQHWAGLYYTTFASLETEAYVFNASFPGPAVHTDIGITGPRPASEFYRT